MWQRVAALGLLVAVALVAFLPVSALADGELELDVGHGHGSGREGDPLDTNDAGGNPDPGDDVQDTTGSSSRSLLGIDFWSTRVLIVPQYNGTTITFQVIILSEASDFLEGPHAR